MNFKYNLIEILYLLFAPNVPIAVINLFYIFIQWLKTVIKFSYYGRINICQ